MNDLILTSVTRLLVPFIQVYGIAIIMHGHLSPGGGFSGGVVLGSSLLLFTLVYGLEKGSQQLSHSMSSRLESGAILWMILIGCVGIWRGQAFLANRSAGFYFGQASYLFNAGLIPLATVAIGIKVASTLVTLFHHLIDEEAH